MTPIERAAAAYREAVAARDAIGVENARLIKAQMACEQDLRDSYAKVAAALEALEGVAAQEPDA